MTVRRYLTGVLAALALAAALRVGGRAVGPVPALGPLFDPAHGVWGLARTAEFPRRARARIPGLRGEVEVRYDDRGVPHLYAANEEDAARALGFVVARDRLFQLELQSRATEGTLSELLGARTLDADREARRDALAWAAERRWVAMPDTAFVKRMAVAYADGVNAYIAQMPRAALPLEYRLLGATPRPYRPEYAAYLMVRMGLILASGSPELERDAVIRRIGRAATDALFPAHHYVVEPIQPNGQAAPRVEGVRIPGPVLAPEEAPGGDARAGDAGRDPGVGSNNWAVMPHRTRNGFALLANDPHLELSLPAIWYEAHVVVRDSTDVYGVTFAGAPFVVLGFTRDVAWGVTNTGADVADYYVETVDDSVAPTRYRLDGAWVPLDRRIERVRNRAGAELAVDTVWFTHRGPMRRIGDRWISRRWTVAEPDARTEFWGKAARATSAAEWLRIAEEFTVPAQNMVVIDRGGHVAIRSTGCYPVRPGDRGDTLFDGSTRASDWRGCRPLAEYPQAVDPAQGFVASANQEPVDPPVAPFYLGSQWESPWRALRINRLLRQDSAVTPARMAELQVDPGNERAEYFVPVFVAAADAVLARAGDDTLRRARDLLAAWDRRFTPASTRAVLFEYAMQALASRTWDELAAGPAGPDGLRPRIATPGDHVLAALVRDAGNPWWDERGTPAREGRDETVAAALRDAFVRALARHGEPDAGGWRWDGIRTINIHHLLRLPALSRLGIPVQGGVGTLWPATPRGTHSASWRLVVEAADTMRAWGIYPGGQSGNPVSARYDDRLPRWAGGLLDTLNAPRTPEQVGRRERARLTLAGGR